MARAIQMTQTGGPEVLTLTDVEVPEPAANEVLVKVSAAGVNFIETYQRSGVYRVDLPFTPGSEGAGTVTAVGSEVTNVSVGDLVATASGRGSYSEYMLVEESKLARIPDGIDLTTAAALPLQGFTSHYLINSTYDVQPGDVVLTTAGAGGVGGLMTQMLKAKGATVITTTSSDEKAAIAKAKGADYVLKYDEVPEKVLEITDGRGVDVAYDGVGKDTFDNSLASLRIRGMLVLFGGASGQVPPFDLQRLNSQGSISVCRPTLAHYTLTAEEVQWRANDVFGMLADGKLDVSIGGTYDLADAGKAHADLESGSTTGKLVLTV
ncbi:quinone oxidoreductase [Pseudoglutamicibacter cumminsii]|uniref:quinone oxidoreductase family protein n=1 Tax=Pseudoglutamicibacter cumminsii TaxID=156979 RepID=UPI002556B6AB|nr:quinone oxidoreductase [Pseudoglutamicibacter cumminsii]MDK7082737.1 quinone oxidoreductase [Pseudoglutamicibacter cumminsii]